jgi:hypothetical protein
MLFVVELKAVIKIIFIIHLINLSRNHQCPISGRIITFSRIINLTFINRRMSFIMNLIICSRYCWSLIKQRHVCFCSFNLSFSLFIRFFGRFLIVFKGFFFFVYGLFYDLIIYINVRLNALKCLKYLIMCVKLLNICQIMSKIIDYEFSQVLINLKVKELNDIFEKIMDICANHQMPSTQVINISYKHHVFYINHLVNYF